MEIINGLCNNCAAIPFDAENPPFGRYAGREYWELGTREQIRSRTTCPLCRLVSFVLLESKKVEDDSDLVVAINWSTGFGRYGAFQLDNNPIGCLIYFVSESPNPRLRVRSSLLISKPHVDLTRVGRWLSTCIDHHDMDCNAPLEPNSRPNSVIAELNTLRVIDVVDRCVIETRFPCRYLALSYVWGGVPNFRLTTNNKHALTQAGVLRKIWPRLPRTIRDAIELVEGLHERYLWIDALCLVQNDPADMQNGVGVMDLIYERAIMTIIAACCDHADHGLPGLTRASRFTTQRVEQIRPGIKLGVHSEVDHLLRHSTYYRRAWT